MKQTYTDNLPPSQAAAELIHHTPLSIVVLAVRTCTATEDDWQGVSDAISDTDRDMLVNRILTPRDADNPMRTPPHSSVLEHLVYTYRLSFSRLRTDKNALWEFRQLAWAIYDALPESHRFLYDNVIHARPEWLCQD